LKRLAEFIQDNTDLIIDEWEAFAYGIPTDRPKMTRKALRDHLPQILMFIAKDMKTLQSQAEQISKSHGEAVEDVSLAADTAAEIHGALRLENGFDIIQMVSEFRALRASVTRLWIKESKGLNEHQLSDLVRFNEAIDQALTESVARFTKDLDTSKDLFLGILGHDLRNPLGAISMSADLLKMKGPLNEMQEKFTTQIKESSIRIGEIVTTLLDLTRLRLGGGMVIEPHDMDCGKVAQKIIDEMHIVHPQKNIILDISGNPACYADAPRIEQVLSNLIGNAIQYGRKGEPITVKIEDHADQIMLSVHNMGAPIPSSKIRNIFDSLVRGSDGLASNNLGLGLYIANTIILAHGGELSVKSSEEEGTIFTALLPRYSV